MNTSVQEGSVTFSLIELGRLEEERIAAERKAIEDAARSKEVARAAAEQQQARAREEAERKVTAERREIERAVREEAARIEAIKAAALEKARLLAVQEGAAEERERQHRRDVEITLLQQGGGERRLRRVVYGQFGALAAVTFGAAFAYFGVIGPAHARSLAADGAQIAERDQTIALLQHEVSSKGDEIAAARRDASAASADAASLSSEVTRLKSVHGEAHHVAVPPAPTVHHQAVTGLSTHCDPGSHDPLCASLGQ